jgi:3-hydroxybutyryl-CoA dehydratase
VTGLHEGAEFTLEAELTEQMVADFTRLSGDNAPLHTDASFAHSKGFEDRLVHGALLVALVSRFVGVHFPGPRGLWLKVDVRFPSPCYAPDTLTIRGRVVQASEATSSVVIDISIVNRRQVQVLHAKSFHKID